jgi:hypothetical protein
VAAVAPDPHVCCGRFSTTVAVTFHGEVGMCSAANACRLQVAVDDASTLPLLPLLSAPVLSEGEVQLQNHRLCFSEAPANKSLRVDLVRGFLFQKRCVCSPFEPTNFLSHFFQVMDSLVLATLPALPFALVGCALHPQGAQPQHPAPVPSITCQFDDASSASWSRPYVSLVALVHNSMRHLPVCGSSVGSSGSRCLLLEYGRQLPHPHWQNASEWEVRVDLASRAYCCCTYPIHPKLFIVAAGLLGLPQQRSWWHPRHGLRQRRQRSTSSMLLISLFLHESPTEEPSLHLPCLPPPPLPPSRLPASS